MSAQREKVPKAYRRYIESMASHVDAAVAMCIAINLDRDGFVDMCGNAYDWLKRWHDTKED